MNPVLYLAGFHLSASVCPPNNVVQMKGNINVAIMFDRRRISSCTCTCDSSASWCSHVVAVCLFRIHQVIFTFPLWVFKGTFTFEMSFIPSWTNRFKPHPHTRHLSWLTSSPSNTIACLLAFARRWTCFAMTFSVEFWRFGYSKPYVMSDLIEDIWKTSQARWKLKIDSWQII